MKLSILRAGVALLPLLFAVPTMAQETKPPAPAAEAPAAPAAQPAAPAAQAQPQGQQAPAPKEFAIDAGGWKGGAVPNPQNHQFSHCDISKPYDGGLTLAFTINPEYLFNVAIVKKDWGLKEGEKGKGRIRVDGAYDKSFDAVPVSPSAYVVPVGQGGDLFQALAKGNKAIVTTPKGEFTFPLSGTGAGLTALKSCIDTARAMIAQAQGGAAPANGQAANGQIDPHNLLGAQGFGMTVGVLQQLLSAAGMDKVAIADPRKLPRDPLQVNHAWQVGTDGKVVGGMHQEPRGDAVEIDQFAKRYLEIMKSVCAAEWQSTDQPAVITGDNAVKRAELDCKMNGQPIFASLVFTLDDHFYTVFFHQSLQSDKALAEDAANKIGNYIQTLMTSAAQPDSQAAPQGAAPDAGQQPAPAAAAPATPPADGGQAAPAPAAPAPGSGG